MNNQSPFVPQGSLPEQKNKNRTRVKIAVFFVLAVHGIGLMALLMQGCKNPNTDTANTTNSTETNPPPILVATNPVVPPESNSFVAQPTPVAPPDTNTVPTAPPPGATEYKIAKGDTLSGVAKKFHVSLKSIQEANPGISPTKLRVGQTVHVPAATTVAMTPGTSGKAGSVGAGPATDSASGEHTYSVQAGDTLTRIASKFGTSVKVIRASNNLHTDRITVGQKLKLPAKASTPAAAGVSSPEPTTLASVSTSR
jgi:LysM repeat protein